MYTSQLNAQLGATQNGKAKEYSNTIATRVQRLSRHLEIIGKQTSKPRRTYECTKNTRYHSQRCTVAVAANLTTAIMKSAEMVGTQTSKQISRISRKTQKFMGKRINLKGKNNRNKTN